MLDVSRRDGVSEGCLYKPWLFTQIKGVGKITGTCHLGLELDTLGKQRRYCLFRF